MMSRPHSTRGLPLAARMALVIGGFGLVGSAALVWWVLAEEASLSRQRFLEEGRSNAAFIDRTGLPASPQMARQLGEVLGLEVRFRNPAGEFVPPAAAGSAWQHVDTGQTQPGEVHSRDGWEWLTASLSGGGELWLLQKENPAWRGLLRSPAITGLALFWAVLLALALGISRTVVRPLKALAGALPRLSDGKPLEIPAAARRGDEIGALASALEETHTQWVHERNQRLEGERMALLGRMAAGLAHEINNPAAAIRLHAQLLARPADPGSPEGASARTIALEAERISELVNQWLFLSRPAPAQVSPVSLAPLLNDSLAAARPAAEHTGVSLETDCPPDAVVFGDTRRLRQILGNLLSNALHASPEGGTVFLRVVRSHDRPGFWEIRCEDEGPGFSPEALVRGKELFFSKKEGGLGIGLSVSSEIAIAHGGDLHLANSPCGATVTLLLPSAGPYET